jgi:hypothetical protein
MTVKPLFAAQPVYDGRPGQLDKFVHAHLEDGRHGENFDRVDGYQKGAGGPH